MDSIGKGNGDVAYCACEDQAITVIRPLRKIHNKYPLEL